MTDKVIVYTNSKTGIMAVCIPAPAGRMPGEDEGAWLERVKARSVPSSAKDVRIIPRADIPKDRTFRDAWALRNGKPGVDMEKAREVHRKRIRRKRKAQFRELDAAYQRADEAGDAKAKSEIAGKRQKLRDAPAHPAIDVATTPEELKSANPLESV